MFCGLLVTSSVPLIFCPSNIGVSGVQSIAPVLREKDELIKPALREKPVFNPNVGKYGPEKLLIRTLSTQC